MIATPIPTTLKKPGRTSKPDNAEIYLRAEKAFQTLVANWPHLMLPEKTGRLDEVLPNKDEGFLILKKF